MSLKEQIEFEAVAGLVIKTDWTPAASSLDNFACRTMILE